jgi:hypothetical protein
VPVYIFTICANISAARSRHCRDCASEARSAACTRIGRSCVTMHETRPQSLYTWRPIVTNPVSRVQPRVPETRHSILFQSFRGYGPGARLPSETLLVEKSPGVSFLFIRPSAPQPDRRPKRGGPADNWPLLPQSKERWQQRRMSTGRVAEY